MADDDMGILRNSLSDRRNLRVFSDHDAMSTAALPRNGMPSVTGAEKTSDDPAIERLRAIEWDFASAKTGYLTHNLHPYPAKFIPQIPHTLIQELSSIGETIADIFCGSGTTLVEALQLKRHAIGIDANPLATSISRAKTTALLDQDFALLHEHKAACEAFVQNIQPRGGDLFYDGNPFTSTGWRPHQEICEFWFLPHVVEELAELRLLIESIPSDAVKNLCLVTLSSIIVAVSKQDSDTRYVRRKKTLHPRDTVRKYLAQLSTAIGAVRELSDLIEDDLTCRMFNRNILDMADIGQFDLVVTSPPYPNAYSYHLYHRTRLIWLGHDPEAFKRIEIGSHRKYSAKGAGRATEKTFRAEFETIFQWLRLRLRDRRYACFVIGDSTLASARIDNASLIANAGTTAGFREVARISRPICATRKAFNPKIGKIKTENILILRKV